MDYERIRERQERREESLPEAGSHLSWEPEGCRVHAYERIKIILILRFLDFNFTKREGQKKDREERKQGEETGLRKSKKKNDASQEGGRTGLQSYENP